MSLSQDVSSDTSLNICVVDFDSTTTYLVVDEPALVGASIYIRKWVQILSAGCNE